VSKFINTGEFRIWCEHYYNICREPSILGASNHGLLIEKNERNTLIFDNCLIICYYKNK